MKIRHFFFAALILSGILSLASYLQAAGPQATVFLVEGQVSFKQNASADWQQLQKGQAVTENSHILTAKNSRCEINLGQGKSAARVAEDSYVIIESLDPISLKIQSGKLYALARNLKKGSSFAVKTPTVIAAARGTGWIQTLNSVKVLEDTVHVKNEAGQEADVPAGKELDILDDGKLGETREISDETKQEWSEFDSASGSGGSTDTGFDPADADQATRDLENLDKTNDAQNELKDSVGLPKDEKNILDELKPDEEVDSGGDY